MSHCCPVCGGASRFAGVRLSGYQVFACEQCSFQFAPDAFGVAVDYDAVYETPEYVGNQVLPLRTAAVFPDFARIPTYRPFFRNLGPGRGRTLLDVGCGVGRFCHAAHHAGWEVTGIDVSPRAVEIGSRHARFPLRRVSAEEMLREMKRFDVVTAFEVLEHLSNPREFLVQLRDLSAPAGLVFCTVPNWDCQEVQTATRPDWVPPIHLGFFTAAALQKVGERAGFTRSRVGSIFTDTLPRHPVRMARWLVRRLRGRSRQPLGLWLQASK